LAQVEGEEARLRAIQKELDRELGTGATARVIEVQVTALAQAFQAPKTVIHQLLSQKRSWGEVTIRLAMAQYLWKTNQVVYAAVADAMHHVNRLRDAGLPWGQIAKGLGFKLGPVIRMIQYTREEVRAERERLTFQLKIEATLDRARRAEQEERESPRISPTRQDR
jgi:hypothetical protein